MPERPSTAGDESHRAVLFQNYSQHVDRVDPQRSEKVAWFRHYFEDTYASLLQGVSRSVPVLDVGCSRGYLLEALRSFGFSDLTGVDISTVDIERAQAQLPAVSFVASPAIEYLEQNRSQYGIVILRAVLEHTPKSEIFPLLSAIHDSLRPGGTAVVDVPNMAWLFAGHERYMDLTHEVGFTRESLSQAMSVVFDAVVVSPVDHLSRADRRAWRTRVGRAVLGRLLRWADPQGASNPVFARNLVALGKRRASS